MSLPNQIVELLTEQARAQRALLSAAAKTSLSAFEQASELNLSTGQETVRQMANGLSKLPSASIPSDPNVALTAFTSLVQNNSAPLQQYAQEMAAIGQKARAEWSQQAKGFFEAVNENNKALFQAFKDAAPSAFPAFADPTGLFRTAAATAADSVNAGKKAAK